MAAGEGFEPSHTESESAVLPLHKPAIFAHSCRTNRYYYTGKQEFVKDFFEKNNICRFQPLLSNFSRKTPAPRASSEADIIIPQVRSGAESAFSFNFICHQRPGSPFVPRDFVFSCTEEIWTWIVIRLLECRVAVFSAYVWTVCLTFFQRWSREEGRASRICITGVQFFLYGYLPTAVV